MYHGFECTGLDYDMTLRKHLQRAFAEVVCTGLDSRFIDNDLNSCFKILNPTNMPSRQIGLQNRGLVELKKLLAHYGHDRSQEGSNFPPTLM